MYVNFSETLLVYHIFINPFHSVRELSRLSAAVMPNLNEFSVYDDANEEEQFFCVSFLRKNHFRLFMSKVIIFATKISISVCTLCESRLN